MTGTSLLPQAAQAAGIPFSVLLDRLIELVLEGKKSLDPSTEDHQLIKLLWVSEDGPQGFGYLASY
jgi:hypothetical protein